MFENFTNPSPAANEFRSDTFTTPTPSMITALASATLGDAVYNEDISTCDLEAKVAKLAGKEKGLFCVSSTLSNQIAIRTNLLQPPHAVLCDYRSHVFTLEAGGMATLSQAMPHVVIPKNDIYMTLEDDIIPNIVPDDGEIHGAPTKLISLECTLHGMLYPIEEIQKISEFARANDIRLHLDGARLWNALVALGVPISEYCQYFDSVSLCLSKTIGAPIGSVLVGDSKFITKANHFKKQNGGGIRQSGILAVMASTAIDENICKLELTHEWAREVGEFLTNQGVKLVHPVETNFVFVDFIGSNMDPGYFEQLVGEAKLNCWPGRIAFHYQNSREAIDKLKEALQKTIDFSKTNPYSGDKKGIFYAQPKEETK